MEYILETQNLTKVYGDKEAASDVNLHIREGQIYGLIGRNGAGKTTIMRMISGRTPAAANSAGSRKALRPNSCFRVFP